MTNKGYPYALYHLDLLPKDTCPISPDGGPVIPIPQGYLITQPSLRSRGSGITTAVCYKAVASALPILSQDPPTFAAAGFTATWAKNLEYWAEQMWFWDDERIACTARISLKEERKREALTHARTLFRRLRVALSFAGLDSLIELGPTPAKANDTGFCLQMESTLRRLVPYQNKLAECGFGTKHKDELEQAIQTLPPLWVQLEQETDTRHQLSGKLAVIRGAIYGDLKRLCTYIRSCEPAILTEQINLDLLFGQHRSAKRLHAPLPAPPAP